MSNKEAINQKLEDHINNVSYDWLNNVYVPSMEAIQFINFIKMVNGSDQEENKSPVMHMHMVDGMIKGDNNLFVVFRGGAKTTVVHEYAFLYMATYGTFFDFGEVDVAMYVSDTMDNGVKSMRNQLEHRWNKSEFLQQYVPKVKFTDDRWEFENASGKKLYVKGFGATTGVRGFKAYGKRPTWCGFDDLMSDKNAKSPTILQDISDIVYKAARQAMHPTKRKVNWTGTPFNKADALYKAAGSTGWNTYAYPVAEKFPCEPENFKGAWTDRFTYDFLKGEYQMLVDNGKLAAFNQELMLRVTSEEDRLIQDSDILWYDRTVLLQNKGKYNFYITTDFATSESESADYSVISVWALNSSNYWFLVDGVCKRQLMDKNVNDLFRLAQLYSPQSVGIEVNGQQKGFIQWIQKEMMQRNQWFNLASNQAGGQPGIRNSGKKFDRFKTTAAPWFKAKRMYFPEELKGRDPLMIEMEEELTFISVDGFKSAHDDAADTVTMLDSIEAYPPTQESHLTQDIETNIWKDDTESVQSTIDNYIV